MVFFCEDDVLNTVKLLVDYGYDPRQVEPNSSGKLPFYIAVERAHISVARYLISLDIKLPSNLLLVALKLWDLELTTAIGVKVPMARLLVDNGADIHVRTEAGDSLLHVALQSFYEEDALGITKLLVGYGCDPFEANSSGKSSLHIAIEQAHISVARYLLSLDVPLPSDILVTLNPGGIWRTARIVRFLVDNGANVHACTDTGDSVFHIGLGSFQPEDEALELAKLLVGYGCDPLAANFSGKIPLHIAVEQAHISVVQFLLSLDISLPPDLLLFTFNSQELVIGAKISMIQFLIHSGAGVHAHAETGDSVFHIVLGSFNGDDALSITELLISYGCDPLEPNSSGKTPLHIAVEEAHTSVVQYLLSLGIFLPPDILVTLDPHGMWKTVQMICFLLENGADVDARNDVGDSILHIVLELFDNPYEARDVVELLVLYGCNPLEANSRGKTPLRIAVERQLSFVEVYLRSFGACDEADVAAWYEPSDLYVGQCEWIHVCSSLLLLFTRILAATVNQE